MKALVIVLCLAWFPDSGGWCYHGDKAWWVGRDGACRLEDKP